jgi:hypothetical protein
VKRRTARAGVPCFPDRPYVDPGAVGPLPEPERPMFVFDRELAALEQAFYRHLRRAIDLDALFGLEQALWSELEAIERFADDQVLDVANALLARALERVALDPRRSMKEGRRGPGGVIVEVPEPPHGDCPFCAPPAPPAPAGGSGARTLPTRAAVS